VSKATNVIAQALYNTKR